MGRHSGEELKARMEKLTGKDQVWVADIDLRTIGFMILVPNNDSSLEVDRLDIHPSFQRMDIGTLLIKLSKSLKPRKCKR